MAPLVAEIFTSIGMLQSSAT